MWAFPRPPPFERIGLLKRKQNPNPCSDLGFWHSQRQRSSLTHRWGVLLLLLLLLLLSPSHGIFKKSTQRNLSSKGVAAPFRKGTLCGKPRPLRPEPQPNRAAETTSINQQSSLSPCKSCKDVVRKQQGSKNRHFSRSFC